MKHITLWACVLTLVLGVSCSQSPSIPLQNTYALETHDAPADILQKAAHVVPTANQLAALENEFIAFIHFGPNTFSKREWGTGLEDPKLFALQELDTDQWCEAMASAGMKMVILTVKHHDGFVLWQSRYTSHGICSTDFEQGQGDILRDLSQSCQKYGLKLGIYLSPADLYQIEQPEGLYGNGSQARLQQIPTEVPGRPFENQTTFEFEVDDYNAYFLNQLFELLTEYGPIHELWFDGAHPKRKGGQTYNYSAWKKLIRTLAPEAVIFGREDLRWCGNEAGQTRDTEWNVIPYAAHPDTTSQFPDLVAPDLGSRSQLFATGVNYLHYQPAEVNTSIREGWFYRDDTHQKVRSADDVFDIYERAVGGNAIFLLNIPPNRSGRFSEQDVEVLKETGQRIRATYGVNLLQGATGPKELLDADTQTSYLLQSAPAELLIQLEQPQTLNRVVLQEAISTHGERVEKHAVDAWVDGAWQELAQATNIGYKRILRFPEVETSQLRIRILETRAPAALCQVSAHYYKAYPPQLSYKRTAEGMLSLQARESDFRWKPHGEQSTQNLSGNFSIHYTTDGSTPSPESPQYTAPFKMGEGRLQAIAVLHAEQGPKLDEQLGFIKSDWGLVAVSSQSSQHPATHAFDEDAQTYWQSEEAKASISLDLGEVKTLKGFAYTPPQGFKNLLAAGKIYSSTDGKQWQELATFEFGNLINDPSKRYFYLPQTKQTRYVRLEATAVADGSARVVVGELDFF